MKKILYLVFVFSSIVINGCTVIKIYSSNPPYYTSSTDIYFKNDSILKDSIKVIYNENQIIIRDDGEFDILGRKIK